MRLPYVEHIELSKAEKLQVLEHIEKRLMEKTVSSHGDYALCIYMMDIFSLNNSYVDNWIVTFPEFYKEIKHRVEKRGSAYGWCPSVAVLRLEFIQEFKIQFQ